MQICAKDDPQIRIDSRSTDAMLQDLQADIKTARALAYRKVNQEKCMPSLSDETPELIQERQMAREKMEGEKEGRLHKKIKYASRKDKRRYWKELLDMEEWREVKLSKKE